MDEDLKQKLNESAEALLEWTNETSALLSEQAPLIVEEIIRYGLYSHIFGVCCATILIVAACFLFKATMVCSKKYGPFESEKPAAFFVCGLLCAVAGLSVLPIAADGLIKIITAYFLTKLYGTWESHLIFPRFLVQHKLMDHQQYLPANEFLA